MSEKELRDLLSSASAQLPPEGDLLARAEGRGRTIRRRRRILTGVGAAGLVAVVAFATVIAWPDPTATTLPVANPSTTPTVTAADPAEDRRVRRQALLTLADLPKTLPGKDEQFAYFVNPEPNLDKCGLPAAANPEADRASFTLDPGGEFWTEIATEADDDAARARAATLAQQLRDCVTRIKPRALWSPLTETVLPDAANARLFAYEVTCDDPEAGCGISSDQTGIAVVGRQVLFLRFGSNGGLTNELARAVLESGLLKLERAAE